jgi:hypothetical protein
VEALAEAGAFILEPEGEGEIQSAEKDPLAFVDQQYQAAMAVAQQTVATPAAGSGSAAGGYKEFGNAVTRLSKQDLADVMEGRRRNDQWRYEWVRSTTHGRPAAPRP